MDIQEIIEKFSSIWGANPDKWNWYNISIHQELSEEFIREFKDNVHWGNISFRQKLSEEFIRELKDKLDWDYISIHQKLSEEFIKEFKDKLDWEWLIQNDYCPPRIRINYMREKGLIMKENPLKHIIEYYEEPKKVNKDLEELRKLVNNN